MRRAPSSRGGRAAKPNIGDTVRLRSLAEQRNKPVIRAALHGALDLCTWIRYAEFTRDAFQVVFTLAPGQDLVWAYEFHTHKARFSAPGAGQADTNELVTALHQQLPRGGWDTLFHQLHVSAEVLRVIHSHLVIHGGFRPFHAATVRVA